MIDPAEILFIGIGTSSVLWYRCALPAIHLGADWVGVSTQPPGMQMITGQVQHGNTGKPNYDDYRVVIVQQVYGRAWLKQIIALKTRGIKVLYEVDDYLHGVARQPGHDYAKWYNKAHLAEYEMCMRRCDGIITATDYVARRYARFNAHVYVCPNGLDVARYRLTLPERETTNVGWSGATGHAAAVLPWLAEVISVMRRRENTCFVSLGEPRYAALVGRSVGNERSLGVPFAPIECYPAAMTNFDIALAPSGKTTWSRGKSDLRWLEASALGIPVIADPTTYPQIEDGVTGFFARSPADMGEVLTTLIDDGPLRQRVGEQARQHVLSERTIDHAARAWLEVCTAVVSDELSTHQLHRGAPA